VARYVIDCETLLGLASGKIEASSTHRLFAPTLVRSQALAALYAAARKGEISVDEGLERVSRLNAASLKVRFLGDRALQRQAWKIAEQLGWESTDDAEYVALTTLQADALVTSNPKLAGAVAGLVKTVPVDALRAP
jgi:predicted nucleic acid-binding protein